MSDTTAPEARPSRFELITRFFPELKGATTDAASREAALQINTMACELILADQIDLFDRAFAKAGPGCLVLRLAGKVRQSEYITLDDIRRDAAAAKRRGHHGMHSFLSQVAQQIKAIDPAEAALIVLLDNTRGQLLPIPRSYPAKQLEMMMGLVS